MLTYQYEARDAKTGRKVRATVQAADEKAAAKLIHDEGLSPLSVKQIKESNTGLAKFTNRIKIKDKVLFTRQLSTLINAGLPLVQSLRNVVGQMENKRFQAIGTKIIADVEGGSAFSAALARYPDEFNRVFISLISAGEASGTLDKALERLADQQEKDAEILSKVRGAMIYPLLVLGVMVLVMAFMMIKVLPQVKIMYEGLPGTQLPLVTKLLLAVSNFTVRFWWVILLAAGLAGFFGSRWFKTVGGRSAVDKFKMRAWPIGQLFSKLYMARFSRTGATLVGSGVPLLQVLDITADAVNNVHVEASIHRAMDKVKGGKALSDSLDGDPNFTDLVPNMLRIGEQSGSLEDMLVKIADYYEKEVDAQIRAISTIIEPVLMIVLGVFAFIIVAAILLPIYGLAGKSLIH